MSGEFSAYSIRKIVVIRKAEDVPLDISKLNISI
jgi:hypothetical protein